MSPRVALSTLLATLGASVLTSPLAFSEPPEITSVEPHQFFVDEETVLTIRGSGFTPETRFAWRLRAGIQPFDSGSLGGNRCRGLA